jgi:hypothetical protein
MARVSRSTMLLMAKPERLTGGSLSKTIIMSETDWLTFDVRCNDKQTVDKELGNTSSLQGHRDPSVVGRAFNLTNLMIPP